MVLKTRRVAAEPLSRGQQSAKQQDAIAAAVEGFQWLDAAKLQIQSKARSLPPEGT
jgi:hypothetical protein